MSWGRGCATKLLYDRDATFEGLGDMVFQYWGCLTCGHRYLMTKLDWPPWFYRDFKEEAEANKMLRYGRRPPVPYVVAAMAQGLAINERDEAMSAAEAHADPNWNFSCYQAIVKLATERKEFIADDLWGLVSRPREPRAAGPQFVKAVKNGIIRKTDRKVPSTRRHMTDMTVWESLIHDRAPIAEGAW